MSAATSTKFQLDLSETESERFSLYLYTEEKKEVHAKFLGLSEVIAPPVDTLIGKLMLYLRNLPATAKTPQARIFWESSSFNTWMGMHWLIRKEWIDSYKFPEPLQGATGIRLAKRDTEPMGDLLQALLHLCEKSATVAHFGSYPEYIGGARLFSAIVIEIANYGGIENLLMLIYPIEKTPLAQKKEGKNKKNLCRDLKAIVRRIEKYEPPEAYQNLFVAQLVAHAVQRAKQSSSYKRKEFKAFTTALRDYFKNLESKQCGLVTYKNGDWKMALPGKGKAERKLVSEPLANKGSQRLMASFFNSE